MNTCKRWLGCCGISVRAQLCRWLAAGKRGVRTSSLKATMHGKKGGLELLHRY